MRPVPINARHTPPAFVSRSTAFGPSVRFVRSLQRTGSVFSVRWSRVSQTMQTVDMYMSYRWLESFNTVRFVTSSQRGLTCVGAECGKEGGGDGPYIRRGAD